MILASEASQKFIQNSQPVATRKTKEGKGTAKLIILLVNKLILLSSYIDSLFFYEVCSLLSYLPSFWLLLHSLIFLILLYLVVSGYHYTHKICMTLFNNIIWLVSFASMGCAVLQAASCSLRINGAGSPHSEPSFDNIGL